MRELKFRVKSDYGDNKWIYFELPWCYNEAFSCELAENTKKETLCQLAEVKDSDGRDIWENDICKVTWRDIHNHNERIILVEYKNGFHFPHSGAHTKYELTKILGNKFDNPELMEELR